MLNFIAIQMAMVSKPKNRKLTAKLALIDPKNGLFKFGLEQKLDHHSCVEFHGDSDGDGFKAQKPIIDPLIGPN